MEKALFEDRLEYKEVGGYLIPDLRLSEDDTEPVGNSFLEEITRPPEPEPNLGRYGRMRRAYLEEHRPITTTDMLLMDEFFPHLMEIDKAAEERVKVIMEQLLKESPSPDKAADQMGWVRHMNALKAQAEETVIAELITS